MELAKQTMCPLYHVYTLNFKKRGIQLQTGLEITARPTARDGLFLRRTGTKLYMTAQWLG